MYRCRFLVLSMLPAQTLVVAFVLTEHFSTKQSFLFFFALNVNALKSI